MDGFSTPSPVKNNNNITNHPQGVSSPIMSRKVPHHVVPDAEVVRRRHGTLVTVVERPIRDAMSVAHTKLSALRNISNAYHRRKSAVRSSNNAVTSAMSSPRHPTSSRSIVSITSGAPLCNQSSHGDTALIELTSPLSDSQQHGECGRWLEAYSAEQSQYNSIATWAEVIVRKVVSDTQHLPTPNPLRTATCCLVLDRISSLYTRFDDIMDVLKDELFSSIYYGWPRSSKTQEDVAGGAASARRKSIGLGLPKRNQMSGELEEEEEDLDDLPFDDTCDDLEEQPRMQYLSSRTAFFTIARNMKEQARKLVRASPGQFTRRTVGRWQRQWVRSIFCVWRNRVHLSKLEASRAAQDIASADARRNAAAVKSHFEAWRVYIRVRRARRGVDPNSEIHKDIMIKTMSRRIKDLEDDLFRAQNAYDDLHDSTSSLRCEMENMRRIVEHYRNPPKPPTPERTPTPPKPETPIDHEAIAREAEEQRRAEALALRRRLLEDPLPPVDEPPKTVHQMGREVTKLLAKKPPKPSISIAELGEGESSQQPSLDASPRPGGGNKTVVAKRTVDITSPLFDALSASSRDAMKSATYYKDVLEWVNLRLRSVNDRTTRMARNLTTDFANGDLYAALLFSVGSPVIVFDEVRAEVDWEARAKVVIRHAQAVLCVKLTDIIAPSDIAQARGRNTNLLFLLHSHFGGSRVTRNCALSNFLLSAFDADGTLVAQSDSSDGEDDEAHVRESKLTNKEFFEWYDRLGCRKLDSTYGTTSPPDDASDDDEGDFELPSTTIAKPADRNDVDVAAQLRMCLGDVLSNTSNGSATVDSASLEKLMTVVASPEDLTLSMALRNPTHASAQRVISQSERKDRIMMTDRLHPALVWFNKVLYGNKIITEPVLTFEEAFSFDQYMPDFLELLVPGSAMGELRAISKVVSDAEAEAVQRLRAETIERALKSLGVRAQVVPAMLTSNLDMKRWKEVRQQHIIILTALYTRFCKVNFPV